METMQAESQVAVIQKSIKVFETAPMILMNHQARSSKALKVADDIITKWNVAFAIPDPAQRMEELAALDQRAMNVLANATTANISMKDARKPVSQLMDMLLSMYTAEENALDPKKEGKMKTIQTLRNQYATEVVKEQQRLNRIAEVKAAKESELNNIRAFINSTITSKLLAHLAERKLAYQTSFNSITLADFEDRSTKLKALGTTMVQNKVGAIIEYSVKAVLHSEGEVQKIRSDVHAAYDWQKFYNQYELEIGDLKRALIDRLPSKLEELQEAKRKADQAEQDRLDLIAKQKADQIIRDKEIAAANAKNKAKLEEANRLAQIAEQERLTAQAQQAEQDRLAAEALQLQREQEDAIRLNNEAAAAKLKADQEADLKRQAEEAMTLFNKTAEVASAGVGGPETRSSIVITVLHSAGWVELFQFWYQREGVKAKLEDIEKMTFDRLKRFAEKAAKDTNTKKGERIESKLMEYSDSIAAVNRKKKAA